MRRDARPSYTFLKGLEPNSKILTFEASLDLGQSDETIATLLEQKRKRGLEETIGDLQPAVEKSAETFSF